jgi:hypothetical protein
MPLIVAIPPMSDAENQLRRGISPKCTSTSVGYFLAFKCKDSLDCHFGENIHAATQGYPRAALFPARFSDTAAPCLSEAAYNLTIDTQLGE